MTQTNHTSYSEIGLIMSPNLKFFIRKVASFIIYYSGLLKAFNFLYMRNKPIILTYHRIADPDKLSIKAERGMCVKPKTFEMQMKYIAKNYRVISLLELCKPSKKIKSNHNKLIITFDDGWKDNYDMGLPILKKFGLPAIIFLSTSFVGTDNWFWPEKIFYLMEYIQKNFEKFDKEEMDFLVAKFPFLSTLDEANKSLEKKVEEIISYLKRYKESEVQRIINTIQNKVNLKNFPKARLILNWDEIREMSKENISFGSHTANHNILTNLTDKEIIEELSVSKNEIKHWTGNAPQAFCYPNYQYNNRIKELVKEAGYFCSVRGGGFNFHTFDKMAVKRVMIHDEITNSKALFACWISGIFHFFRLVHSKG